MNIRSSLFVTIAFSRLFGQSASTPIEAPRFWNDHDLADWATPVSGLNVRAGHYSEEEYYSAPVGEFVRSYPVYFPGREPAGYSEMIRSAKPEPLIKSGARTRADWLIEGKRIFDELDLPYLRNYDPKLIEIVRSADGLKKLGGHAQKDGTLLGLRWVPTSRGLALGQQDCAVCHKRVMSDGSIADGAPGPGADSGSAIGVVGKFVTHDSPSFLELFSPGERFETGSWRWSDATWVPEDINEKVKSLTVTGRDFAGLGQGVLPRFNGSPFYPTKTPDLLALKKRTDSQQTAPHPLRG